MQKPSTARISKIKLKDKSQAVDRKVRQSKLDSREDPILADFLVSSYEVCLSTVAMLSQVSYQKADVLAYTTAHTPLIKGVQLISPFETMSVRSWQS